MASRKTEDRSQLYVVCCSLSVVRLSGVEAHGKRIRWKTREVRLNWVETWF